MSSSTEANEGNEELVSSGFVSFVYFCNLFSTFLLSGELCCGRSVEEHFHIRMLLEKRRGTLWSNVTLDHGFDGGGLVRAVGLDHDAARGEDGL